jgi:(2Fe-2S) ferredoxin
MRRLFRRAGLEGRVRLAFTECLGPCSEANVVFVYVHGRPLWLRRVNSIDVFAAVVDHVRGRLVGVEALAPPLVARSFTWTGGGAGPAPPVADP